MLYKLLLFCAEYGYPPNEALPPRSNKDNQQLREMFLSETPMSFGREAPGLTSRHSAQPQCIISCANICL